MSTSKTEYTHTSKDVSNATWTGATRAIVLVGLIFNILRPQVQSHSDKEHDRRVEIYKCEEPGKTISLHSRGKIIDSLANYARQPGVDISWNPKKVVCTVDKDGELSFHIEKEQEYLVEAAKRSGN